MNPRVVLRVNSGVILALNVSMLAPLLLSVLYEDGSVLVLDGDYGSAGRALRDSLFAVSSVITTTGFITADFVGELRDSEPVRARGPDGLHVAGPSRNLHRPGRALPVVLETLVRQTDDLAPHQTRHQLHRQLRRSVALVQDRVDLHHVEGGHDAGFVDELHDQVCFTVR